MCDDHTVKESDQYLATQGLSRRQFGGVSAGLAVAGLLPTAANAMGVSEQDVAVTTPDGAMDAYFVHPSSGKHPAVIIWPDVLGLRPAFRLMGKRLAEAGYAVIVVNPYYRQRPAPVVGEGASFQDQSTRDVVLPMARSLSPQTNNTDALALVSYLDQQKAVDTGRGVGTMGYCMGGPMTMRTAAAIPERVKAGASFHGGGLVTDSDMSPHLLVEDMQAQFLIAIASNDHERQPEAQQVLIDTFAAADLAAEVEVYEGALHGWCPPDSRVYNEAQAERAWARLLVLFERALA